MAKALQAVGLGSFFGSPIYERVVPGTIFWSVEPVMDWDTFTDILLPAYKGLAEAGRPPYPPVTILKMLVIAYLYPSRSARWRRRTTSTWRSRSSSASRWTNWRRSQHAQRVQSAAVRGQRLAEVASDW